MPIGANLPQPAPHKKTKARMAFQIGGGAGAAKAGRAALTAQIRASWEHPRAPKTQNFPSRGGRRHRAAGATQGPSRPARRSGGAFHPAWSEGGAVR